MQKRADDLAAKIGILTASDRASGGVYVDESGPAIEAALDEILATVWIPCRRLIADEQPQIERALIELLICPCRRSISAHPPLPSDLEQTFAHKTTNDGYAPRSVTRVPRPTFRKPTTHLGA